MYKLLGDGSAIQKTNSNGLSISFPTRKDNSYYRKYLEWLAEGNTPEPADPLPEVVPVRDLAKEIDELTLKVSKLEKKP